MLEFIAGFFYAHIIAIRLHFQFILCSSELTDNVFSDGKWQPFFCLKAKHIICMKNENIKVAEISGAKFRAFLLEMASQVKDNDIVNAQKGTDKILFLNGDTALIIGRTRL